jgi:pimeloyl-ACP methyl ester carboxylesterase
VILEYWEVGEGPVIVLLHGFPQGPQGWETHAELLAQAGYRVIVPTQRGYRLGDRLRPRWHYTFGQLADDILETLDQLKIETCVIVGHDLGAAVAWRAASDAPSRVSRVISVSLPYPPAFLQACLVTDQALRSWYFLPVQSSVLSSILFSPKENDSRARLRRMLLGMGMTDAAVENSLSRLRVDQLFLSAIRWYQALLFDSPFEVFSRCHCRTTILFGSDDILTTKRSIDYSANWMMSSFSARSVSGMTHWLENESATTLVKEILMDL